MKHEKYNYRVRKVASGSRKFNSEKDAPITHITTNLRLFPESSACPQN